MHNGLAFDNLLARCKIYCAHFVGILYLMNAEAAKRQFLEYIEIERGRAAFTRFNLVEIYGLFKGLLE